LFFSPFLQSKIIYFTKGAYISNTHFLASEVDVALRIKKEVGVAVGFLILKVTLA